MAQEQTDFGWADTPPLLKGINTGMKVKSVGVFLQKGPASIEFLADKGITTPADLKGKTVGGTPGDAMYATFPALAEGQRHAGHATSRWSTSTRPARSPR